MKDFAERSEAYAKRAKALDVAAQKQKGINVLLNLGTILFIGIAVILMWSRLDAKVLVGVAVATFVARWISNMVVHFAWTTPMMKKIDQEAPAPPSRS